MESDETGPANFVTPEYNTPSAKDPMSLFQHAEPVLEKRRLSDARASSARTSREFWDSGIFDSRTLPYLYSPEADIFEPKDKPSKPQSEPSSVPRERVIDARAENVRPDDTFQFQRCCSCSGLFEYRLEGDKNVCILAGLPPQDSVYTAISYVWGNVKDLVVRCAECNHLTVFPMQSASKFRDIMALAGPDSIVWLDALSIDQADHEDVAKQLAAMGAVYKNASTVSVLLPREDISGFELLKTLTTDAKDILGRPAHFILDYEDARKAESQNNTASSDSRYGSSGAGELITVGDKDRSQLPSYPGRLTSIVCNELFATFRTLKDEITTLAYWKRAWTFQEWALARDLTIMIEEGATGDVLTSVKTSIFSAAALICQYICTFKEHAAIDIEYSSNHLRRTFSEFKRMFPLEDYILAPEEVDEEEYTFQNHMASVACDQLLGLRVQRRNSGFQAQRARLHLMLDAFDSERQAKYEADLVACWASMCNIPYSYSKDDTCMEAVTKAVTSMRRQGIQVFDFVPQSMDPATDIGGLPHFFRFAHTHPASASKLGLPFEGAPLLTGRADPSEHLRAVLLQDSERGLRLPVRQSIQKIEGAYISKTVSLIDIPEVTSTWEDCIYSQYRETEASWFSLPQILVSILKQAADINAYKLSLHNIVLFVIPVTDRYQAPGYLAGWAMVPSWVPTGKLWLARETTNAVFTVCVSYDTSENYHLAYLTITDQISGTILLRADQRGDVNLRIDSPKYYGSSNGFGNGVFLSDLRTLKCRVRLGELRKAVQGPAVMEPLYRIPRRH